MRRLLLSLLLIPSLAAPAFAWNKPGHMIVAAIAYDDLKANHPDVIAKVLAILSHHPEVDKFVKAAGTVPAEDQQRYLFMIAARWPDDVRSEKKAKSDDVERDDTDDKTDGKGGYSHAPWHFIDFPVVFPADKGKVDPEPPAKENALTAIGAQTKTLQNSDDAARQAIALCWIEHLVGDLHQPLHCSNLYSLEFPKGDRGGNSQGIKVEDSRATVELHGLWDGLMTSSERYQTCAKIATDLERRPDLARSKLPGVKDGKPDDWAWESYTAAVHTAYLDGAIKSSVYKRGAVPKDAPTLPDNYLQNAKVVAEQRIALAGYRLADQLVTDLSGQKKADIAKVDSPNTPPADPTPAGRQEFTGPKGGHYHFDANGKKVYDK